MHSRYGTGPWLTALVLALLAGTFGHGQSVSDHQRAERLAALGRLWLTIDYCHPYLAYRDIDWQEVLFAAIPKARAAASTAEYRAVVEKMLAALKDSATTVLDPSAAPSADSLRPSSYRVTPDNIGVWIMGDRSTDPDLALLDQGLRAAAADLSRLRGIILDLRSRTPANPFTRGLTSLLLNQSRLAMSVTSEVYLTPAERTRMLGAFQMSDSRRVSPATGARDVPVVFIVNEHADLPVEMFALQATGKAKVVAEGEVTDTGVTARSDVQLTEGLHVRFRVGELVFANGVQQFQPDVQVPHYSDFGIALAAAEDLIRRFDTRVPSRRFFPHVAISRPPATYSEAPYPSLEHRLLALFRLWGAITYLFPYRDLMTHDWDHALTSAVSAVESADDALAYHLAVAEMVSRIGDSHAVVQSPVLGEHFGTAAPPVRVRLVEERPLNTGFRNEQAARSAGVDIGDVIVSVDGEPVQDRMARYAKYVAGSTPQAVNRDVLDRRSISASTGGILFGAPDSTVTLVVQDRAGQRKTVVLPRTIASAQALAQRTGDIFKLLSDRVGYADLDRLTASMLDAMFEKFKDTKGIVFDMRGYPRMSQSELAARLTNRSSVPVALVETIIPTVSDSRADNAVRSTTQVAVQTLRGSNREPYRGLTVMLIDERTQSAAEHMALFLKAANGTIFVGSHTAGANGNVASTVLPGRIVVSRSFLGIKHVDGKQLQRVGLEPDIPVTPTIRGIQRGIDELLDAAITYLNDR